MTGRRIDRRAALAQVVGGTLACLGGTRGAGAAAPCAASPLAASPRAAAPEISVTVVPAERLGRIRPALYGHFAEHIGGVIYDGIWVGTESKVPHLDGIRRSLVEHVRRLGRVVVRWPGGCFADRYHWRDGIGLRERRPRRFGRWRDDTEPNGFGTHEFIRFCRLTGVEPYFAANVGTGSAEEFQQWVEYANAPPGSTTIADERASNGDREPFGVRLWGVGNESWGCGGKFTPEDYCTEYRRFTEWVPGYGVPLSLIAAGPNGNDLDWTRRFFRKWRDGARAPLDGWAAHYYCGTTGHALRFTVDQWYQMLHQANQMDRLIQDQWAAMGEFDPERKVKLVIDEWGAWHPAGTEINPRHLFEQMGSLRDALVAALTLDTFNRHAERISMANIAQLVNNLHSLFLADGDRFVATPTFHVFEMYRAHHDAESVRMEVAAPLVEFRAGDRAERIFRLAGSASLQVKEKSLTVTLVHTHATEPAEARVILKDAAASSARGTVLSAPSLDAHNTFEAPEAVRPSQLPVVVSGGELTLTLPPASVARLEVTLG